MKYNDNGEYKDIYVKAFDTLPVGTIVDYDGETVPSGYEEVSDESELLATTTKNGLMSSTDKTKLDSFGNIFSLCGSVSTGGSNSFTMTNDKFTGNYCYLIVASKNIGDGNIGGIWFARAGFSGVSTITTTGTQQTLAISINNTTITGTFSANMAYGQVRVYAI
jgi:hypothetical protein